MPTHAHTHARTLTEWRRLRLRRDGHVGEGAEADQQAPVDAQPRCVLCRCLCYPTWACPWVREACGWAAADCRPSRVPATSVSGLAATTTSRHWDTNCLHALARTQTASRPTWPTSAARWRASGALCPPSRRCVYIYVS